MKEKTKLASTKLTYIASSEFLLMVISEEFLKCIEKLFFIKSYRFLFIRIVVQSIFYPLLSVCRSTVTLDSSVKTLF